MFQRMYDKATNIIKQGTCMKYYDASKLLYIETDALVLAWLPDCYS